MYIVHKVPSRTLLMHLGHGVLRNIHDMRDRPAGLRTWL